MLPPPPPPGHRCEACGMILAATSIMTKKWSMALASRLRRAPLPRARPCGPFFPGCSGSHWPDAGGHPSASVCTARTRRWACCVFGGGGTAPRYVHVHPTPRRRPRGSAQRPRHMPSCIAAIVQNEAHRLPQASCRTVGAPRRSVRRRETDRPVALWSLAASGALGRAAARCRPLRTHHRM